MASITTWFGMEQLAPAKARALAIVYAASISLMMGVNFIQPALPALSEPFRVSDAQLSWIMTLFTAPAIVLSPIFGVIGRNLMPELYTGLAGIKGTDQVVLKLPTLLSERFGVLGSILRG